MKDKILKRLKEDFDYLVSLGYEVLRVDLQGSQNYGLAYEGSDIDTKAIVIPKFEDIILNKQPISTTLILESNEHIDVKDIRLMFDCFKKQNINFIEILFTKYSYINPKYEKLYQPMIDNNEKIARYNTFAALNCMSGMILEKLKALDHPYPSILDKIEKYGYDPKQLHHICRLSEFIDRYIAGESYKDCLISKQPEYLISVKKDNSLYNLEEAKELGKKLSIEAKDKVRNYMLKEKLIINHDTNKTFEDVLTSVFKKSLFSQLTKKKVVKLKGKR